MSYLFFWIRVAARRFVSLFKSSPVVIIGAIVIIAAFIVARNDFEIILNAQWFVFALSFFIFVSLLLSFKTYPLMSLLIIYSKSALKNRAIRILFFARQASFNNILLILFDIAALKGIVKADYQELLPAVTFCSLLLSIFIMYFKNEVKMRKINKKPEKAAGINPVVKSAIYDYFTSDFFQTAAVSIVLFIIITVEFVKNQFYLSAPENPSIWLIGMTAILSLGFMGIIDSISHINWKFFSVISAKSYSYHLNRSILFLAVFFGLLIALFIFMAAFSGIVLLLKYIYCMIVLLLLSINISFTMSGIFYKVIMFTLTIVLTVWISTLHIAFLPVLAAPVLITFLKAKDEYREWYYL
ncbi:MAG: hypothetical protein LBQ93_05880 [Treponema sp.]|jgi:hypothetical protein|nr:hypothetical protein [Treponema sp.]